MDYSTPHTIPTDALRPRLETGLSTEEVDQLRQQHGFNELPDPERVVWWELLGKQFLDVLVLILFAAAAISALTGHWMDMYVILVVVLINALIGFGQEYRAAQAVAALREMVTPEVKVIRDGTPVVIPARELVPGDVLRLEEGDLIPADGRLVEVHHLRTMESALTGESVPEDKQSEPLEAEVPMADQTNMCWRGTHVVGGAARAVVTATGLQTELGKIAASVGQIRKTRTHFRQKTDQLGRVMGGVAIGSAAVLFAIGLLFRDFNWQEILLTSIAAMVSAIPEGLPAILSVVLAVGARKMARRNAIVREFSATETLGAVTTIITDKTGTLTQNVLTIQQIALPSGQVVEVTGTGWEIDGEIKVDGVLSKGDQQALDQLLLVSRYGHQAHVRKVNGEWKADGDPTEAAFAVLAQKQPPTASDVRELDELPFDSLLKLRAALVHHAGKNQLLVIGAPEQILDRCNRAFGEGEPVSLTQEKRGHWLERVSNWSDQAKRVLAVACKTSEEETISPKADLNGLILVGMVAMEDPPRDEVEAAIQQCHSAGIRVIMATGDHAHTGLAIAKRTGIVPDASDQQGLTEQELERMDPAAFEAAIRQHHVFARLTPGMKVRIAKLMQEKGELVAMTGDGVNDAPALKQADVGIAMGQRGTDVSREAAQVVLADDHFATIVHAIEEGRIVFRNARQSAYFLVITNFTEILTLIATVAVGLPLPLTAIQLLWMNLVSDGVMGLGLAVEKGTSDILNQPPPKPDEPILNRALLPYLLINLLLMGGLTIATFQWFLPEGIEMARSAAFGVLGFTQLFNAFNMRSLDQSLFQIGWLSNRWLVAAFAVSLGAMLLVLEVPVLQDIFGFASLSWVERLVLLGASSSVLFAIEGYKWLRRRGR